MRIAADPSPALKSHPDTAVPPGGSSRDGTDEAELDGAEREHEPAPRTQAAEGESPHTLAGDLIELVKLRLNLLVLVTTFIGYCVAIPQPQLGARWWARLALTLLGTVLSAAAASVFNQLWELRLDAKMSRTADRPLPAGRVAPAGAGVLGTVLAITGVAVLAIGVNLLTAGLALATILLYVLVYTPLKTRTTLNTLVGAIPGAIPPVMGVTAATGLLNWDAAALFAILFCWQMPHFLAIAILCRDDYAAAGFKMLPVVDPNLARTGVWIVGFNALLLAATLMPLSARSAQPAGLLYLLSAMVLGLVFLATGVRCALTRDRRDARTHFFTSIIYLPLLLAMLLVDKL